MYDLPKFSKGLIAVLVKSCTSPGEVIAEAIKLSEGDDFVLVLEPSEGIEARLLPAYINAAIRKKDRAMHSGTFSLEILLFISGTMNLGNAIERASARGNEFVIFSSSKKLSDKIISRHGMNVAKKYRLKLDLNKSSRISIISIRDERLPQ